MDVLRSAIAEYEDVLIGKRKAISSYYFSYGQNGNMKLVLQIMRYSFNTYLRWSAGQLRDCLTLEALEHLKLRTLLRHIAFPPELDRKQDLFYIAWLLYPKTVHLTEQDLILRVYKGILEGRLQKYPKEFFTGQYGLLRARVCLRYMIEQHLQFGSIPELYEYFASPQCQRTLRMHKLLTICRDLYDSTVEYLHQTLPREQQDVFLYRFYDFQIRKEELEQPPGAGLKAGDPA